MKHSLFANCTTNTIKSLMILFLVKLTEVAMFLSKWRKSRRMPKPLWFEIFTQVIGKAQETIQLFLRLGKLPSFNLIDFWRICPSTCSIANKSPKNYRLREKLAFRKFKLKACITSNFVHLPYMLNVSVEIVTTDLDIVYQSINKPLPPTISQMMKFRVNVTLKNSWTWHRPEGEA